MIKAGIDYSMSSPAIAIWDDTTPLVFANIKIFNLNGVKKYQGIHGNIRVDPLSIYSCAQERYSKSADWALNILKEHKVEKVNIEGYAMGSTSGLVFNIAENTGRLKHVLWEAGIPFGLPAPGAVKKQFHGKGNANKVAMCEAFREKFGVDISKILGCKPNDAPENDMVDSVAVMLAEENA